MPQRPSWRRSLPGSLTMLGMSVDPGTFLAELRHLATLLLHVVSQPHGLQVAPWAGDLHIEAVSAYDHASRTTLGYQPTRQCRGPRTRPRRSPFHPQPAKSGRGRHTVRPVARVHRRHARRPQRVAGEQDHTHRDHGPTHPCGHRWRASRWPASQRYPRQRCPRAFGDSATDRHRHLPAHLRIDVGRV